MTAPAPQSQPEADALRQHTPTPWFVSGVRYRMNGGEWQNINRYDASKKQDENIACVSYDPRTGLGLADAHFIVEAVNSHATLQARVDDLTKALESIVNAKAISGVRAVVAGWNGEGRDEPYKERHPNRLGATLPKTNCGAVYELDDAMQTARRTLATSLEGSGGAT